MTDFATEYYWVVVCKNRWFHNFHGSSGHKILLGQTDAFLNPPDLGARFTVRCDDCGKECAYRPHDVLRFETEALKSFIAHPLFPDLDRA